MAEAPKDDEAKFNEALKRMLDTKPQPHTQNDKADDEPAQADRKPSPKGGKRNRLG